jgi:hypothetical protein
MASPHLGYIGRSAHSVGGHQLLATEDVLRYLQVWDRHHDAGFLPLCYLASDRCLEDIWFPLSQRCLYYDLYVSHELAFSDQVSRHSILDNGTGAPAGWNWILSLSVAGIVLDLITH